ncbi:MAG TPA: cytochrome c maturation protein CcmE [Catalimonadaceae bacterium]|nr:cytochrome c maturation protein CcmE [Catalimonadaceae bacterium]HPI11253.1 cytochrome c maturation protein CcmE [Catalimonadaceae bacterium]
MKPLHLAGLLAIAVGIAVIISTSGDASSYVCFAEAKTLAKDGDDDKVHVVGQLPKTASGEIEGMQYDPTLDPNYFRFLLVDEKKETQEVIYYKPKPADFERSEKVVVVGAMKNGHFEADKILMKCPSKYQEGQVKTEGEKGT